MTSCASNSVDLKVAVSCGLLNFNIADLSDHCSVTSLQTLEAGLCYWPSFTGMEHCTPHTPAVHMATCLERKVAGRENWFQLLELLPGGSHTFCRDYSSPKF